MKSFLQIEMMQKNYISIINKTTIKAKEKSDTFL